MRLIAYAGTSTVLAAGVILRAFHQRTNFYSACVYLSQSNACLMIITNLVLVAVCLTMLGLQRLLYGPLRAFEIEQLYEKAWYAITETCVAMTIFRDEVGVWFLVMFVCLLVGKVWGWIGEGRVEILEQQPPANPRLFHARLSFSLLLSLVFDISLLRYNVQAVLRMTRPNMMVMFAFEFAILTLSSASAAARYIISLIELHTVNKQRQLKLEERRVQLQAAWAQSRSEAGGEPDAAPAAPAGLEDIDETDIDVPGWEAKGQWVLSLDLAIDFLKLVVYLTFFLILLTLYGLPIHIMRDVFLTLRSFVRRIGDFIGYRRATRDMNERYRDALPEEIAREEICIICREEMRPWGPAGQNDGAQAREGPAGAQAPPATTTWDERSRPKRLPCGHILHFACLRRWLERQQICPTCRRPVIMDDRQAAEAANQRRADNQGAAPLGQVEPGQQAVAGAQPQQPGGPAGGQPGNRARVFNLGPLRIGFGVGTGQVLQDVVHRMQNGQGGPGQNDQQPEQLLQQQQIQQQLQQQQPQQQHDAGNHAQVSFGFGFGRQPRVTQMPATALPASPSAFTPHSSIDIELLRLENQVQQQIRHLRVTAEQVRVVQTLQSELSRLRQMQDDVSAVQPGASGAVLQSSGGSRRIAQLFAAPGASDAAPRAVPADGQAGLPPGLSLPPGWMFVPLYRTDGDRSSEEPSDVPGRSLTPNALFTTPTTTTVSQAPVGQTSDAGSHMGPALAPSTGQSAGNSPVIGLSFHDIEAGPSSSSQRPRPSMPLDRQDSTQESLAFERPDLPSSTPKSGPPRSFAGSSSSAQADWHGQNEADDHHRREGTSENVVGDGRQGDGPSLSSHADDEPSSSSSATAATSRVDKGKGRAVTVEDAPLDDID